MLLQARMLTPERSSLLIAALAGVPLLLMTSQGGSTQEVWRSIELGAEDCLEKPLSQLKLRNIWQHVVRKVLTLRADQCHVQSSPCTSAAELLPCATSACGRGSTWCSLLSPADDDR